MMQWLRVPTLVGLALGLFAIARASCARPAPHEESDAVAPADRSVVALNIAHQKQTV
jgi:hypothetical protein